MTLIIGVLEQGLIYGILALGSYITYKILDFPDLTVDGSFPLGAAVTAAIVTKGGNPYAAFLISALAGAAAGACTGLIHVKCKVRDLLAGIIVMTGLYTVNYRIAGMANVPLFGSETAFDNEWINQIPQGLASYKTLMVIAVVAVMVKVLLDLYLKTKSGMLLRATGDNERLVTTLAKDSGTMKIIGLAISNGLVALGGSVMCQQQRFFELGMGTGTVVICLASVIIGTSVFKNARWMKATTAVVIGSVFYRACVALAMNLGLETTDMKLIMAVLFLIILIVTADRKKKVRNHA